MHIATFPARATEGLLLQRLGIIRLLIRALAPLPEIPKTHLAQVWRSVYICDFIVCLAPRMNTAVVAEEL